jgi:hypothetical protein
VVRVAPMLLGTDAPPAGAPATGAPLIPGGVPGDAAPVCEKAGITDTIASVAATVTTRAILRVDPVSASVISYRANHSPALRETHAKPLLTAPAPRLHHSPLQFNTPRKPCSA